MPTNLTLRGTKGTALTHEEVDDNFSALKTTADAATVAVGLAVVSSELSASSGSTLVGFLPAGSGAAATTVQAALRLTVTVMSGYGVTGDGVTDDTAAIQDCIDANKGKTIIFPAGYTYLHAGILLSGSTYDGTVLVIEGTMKLKASAGANNFQSAVWAGIIFHDCDNWALINSGVINGNRANQADNEYHHSIVVAGCTDWVIEPGKIQEIRGDGIYISQKTLTSNTTNSNRGYIGAVQGYNSADDGRNLISVVSCDNLTLAGGTSYQIGGTIDSVRMPGGFNIEPSQTYHSINHLVSGPWNVATVGTGGIQIAGKAVTNDSTRDWNVNDVTIAPSVIHHTGASVGGFNVFRAGYSGRIKATVSQIRDTAAVGMQIDYADNLDLDLTSDGATIGLVIGQDSTVNDFTIRYTCNDYDAVGLQAIGVNRGTFKGRIYGATSSSSTYAIRTRSNSRGLTQTGVIYSIDCPYDGNNARAFRNEATDTVTYGDGTYIADCDMSGYSSFSVQCDAQIASYNVRGRNFATAIPSNGSWHQGDFVARTNNSALDGNGRWILGWGRITTGTGNVDGTDWITARVSNATWA